MQQLRYQPCWIAGGVLMAILVVVSSLLPPARLPSVQVWDKFEHAFAFLALAAWFAGVLRPARYGQLAIALLAFGVAIEIAQGAMGYGRTADLQDVVADVVGAALGIAVALCGASGWMRGVERLLGVAVPSAD